MGTACTACTNEGAEGCYRVDTQGPQIEVDAAELNGRVEGGKAPVEDEEHVNGGSGRSFSGPITLPNGAVYSGSWKDGIRDGLGNQ